eukprot:gnl/Chilomastix_cuspidata/4613.p1 GENE.gnl/Chilomastix_cuspidata/4613~~gnl/Chilomastix_cuspidata/4613.p1  ORF type:complete len:185 (+),score=66.30 gnl/Chilomastix_cuspidata/4613:15-569(+)
MRSGWNRMDPLREFLDTVYSLKALPRTGWVEYGIPAPESVAGHSFGAALLALLLSPPGIDRDKAIRMALVHDVAESIIGDISITARMPEAEKRRRETAAMHLLAEKAGSEELMQLFEEYEARETPEAQFVKKVDLLDMMLQAHIYERAHKAPLDSFFVDEHKFEGDTKIDQLLHALMTARSTDE